MDSIAAAMRLDGKTALVTGGASGIGAATARRLAAEGAHVWVGDVDEPGASVVADDVDGEAIGLDVADGASVATAVERIGAVDVLVNNAGIDTWGFFLDTDREYWARVIAVNLLGTMACTHAVLPGMHERGGGAIVNVASEAGRAGSAGAAPYSATKAGIIGFTRAIARESARYGVRANAVAPGPVDTPLLAHAGADVGERAERMRQTMVMATAMRRTGRPEEIAAAITFLASDDASYVTGQTLNVSGGLSMS